MKPRSATVQIARRWPPSDGPIRLDLLANPYGPSIRVQEALASADDLHLPQDERAERLRQRLAALAGVPASWLVLTHGIDDLLRRVLLWRRGRGQVVTFPPSDCALDHLASVYGFDVVAVDRSHRYALDLDGQRACRVPAHSIGLVMSPNDPTGTELSTQDAVRLSRGCQVVFVDERHGEFGARTHVPLVREFDNIIVARSFETWAALAGFPFAFAIAPPRIARELTEMGPAAAIPAGSLIAAEATLDDLAYVRATVQRVREEKSRLYRTLRKLNMVRPLPSWANFLLVRVERGNADWFHRELAERDLHLHLPEHPRLEGYLRVSATRSEHTSALKQALIELAAAL